MEFNVDLVDSSSAEMLGEAVLGAENFLTAFANNEAFSTSITLAFGNLINVEAVENFRQQWTSGNFEGLPRIEFCSAAEINSANGAFASATNTIYLSREFLTQNSTNPEAITNVVLEEIGHYIDSKLNASDTAGDEGAIFSALVRGESLSEEQLEQLRAEDDFATITLNGQTLDIEQANFPGTSSDDILNGTTNDDTFGPLTTGNDTVDGGAGSDVLVVDYSTNTYAGGNFPPGISGSKFETAPGEYSGSLGAYKDNAGNANSVEFFNIERFQITGTTAADDIFGGAGNDNITGGTGNDLITAGGGIDVIDGGAGVDTLTDADFSTATAALTFNDTGTTHTPITLVNGSSVTGVEYFNNLQTGSGNDTITYTKERFDTISTGGGNDTINVARGYNTVDGGAGNDVLVVDYSTNTYAGGNFPPGISGSKFETAPGEYSGSLGAYKDDAGNANSVEFSNIERFQITGTTAADHITGGASNDTLNGGLGNDILDGGLGNDTYIVTDTTSTGDTLTDTGGVDIVQSAVTYTLSSSLENLTLTGTTAINGTGNTLTNKLTGNSAINTLSGGAGNDILSGGAGLDTLIGGDGSDTYILDNSSATPDAITGEAATIAGGIDTVQSAINYTLAANLEKLTLTGTTAINGTGNELANTLTGNTGVNILDGRVGNDTLTGGSGNDTLIGGAGNDRLTGGAGKDGFRFNSTAEKTDTITDFLIADDTIYVSKVGFGGGLTAGAAITAAQFKLGTAAGDSSDRFIYNKTSGVLLFDADGTGANASVQFAQLSTGLAMTNNDVFVIA